MATLDQERVIMNINQMWAPPSGPRSRRWTEVETVKFVELYEAEEVLWNMKLTEYKSRGARMAALKRIVQSLNMPDVTAHDIIKKINNIRSTYQQEKTKARVAKEANEEYVSTLSWFHIADRFLPTVMKPKPGKSIRSAENTLRENEDEERPCDPENFVLKYEIEYPSEITSSIVPEISENPTTFYGLTMPEESESPTEEISEHQSQRKRLKVAQKSTSDTFGEYVACKLMEYDAFVQNVVQHKINEILFQADMGHFNRPA